MDSNVSQLNPMLKPNHQQIHMKTIIIRWNPRESYNFKSETMGSNEIILGSNCLHLPIWSKRDVKADFWKKPLLMRSFWHASDLSAFKRVIRSKLPDSGFRLYPLILPILLMAKMEPAFPPLTASFDTPFPTDLAFRVHNSIADAWNC